MIEQLKHRTILPRMAALAILALTAGIPSAWALHLSPTYQIFQLKPGTEQEGQTTLTNNTPDDVTVEPISKDWFTTPENKKFKTQDFLRVKGDKFTLKPNESRVVKFAVAAPKGSSGELVGALSFGTKKPADMVSLWVTVAIYISVEGTEKMDPKISSLSVSVSSDTSVGVVVKNDGNVHARPKGWIYVENAARERVISAELERDQPVFPGNQRLYSSKVKGFRLSEGRYTARIELVDADRDFKFPAVTKKFSVTNNGTVEVQ